jgi:hypothetical protein
MSEHAELLARITELEARIEIDQLIQNYGKSTDASDLKEGHDLFVSLFSDDCVYTIPKFNVILEGNKDNSPVFDEDDPKKIVKPGGVGWMFTSWIFPGQEECFSLLGNITIDVTGDTTATGSDHMYRAGYKSPKAPDAKAKDLEFTFAIHRYKFARINNIWKITWFEGDPIHNTAVVK